MLVPTRAAVLAFLLVPVDDWRKLSVHGTPTE